MANNLDTPAKLEDGLMSISKQAETDDIDAIVNLGNIRPDENSCNVSSYAPLHEIISENMSSKTTTFWSVIGEKEYAKCPQPETDVQAWQNVFAPTNSDPPFFNNMVALRDPNYAENWGLIHKQVLYVGLNMMKDKGNINKALYKKQLRYQAKWVQKTFSDSIENGFVDAVVLMGYGYDPKLMNVFFRPFDRYMTARLKTAVPVMYLCATGGVSDTGGIESNFRGLDTFYELSVSDTVRNGDPFLKLVIEPNNLVAEDVFRVFVNEEEISMEQKNDSNEMEISTEQKNDSEIFGSASSALLENINQISSSTSLDDPTSPQSKARKWLLEQDPFRGSLSTSRSMNRYTIAVIYLSLRLPNIAAHLVGQENECSWTGVTCDAAGDVTKIDLQNSRLTGEIPSEIQYFAPTLEHVDFSENDIVGSIPDGLYSLRKLINLYLHNTTLTGALSPKVSNWAELNNLYLGNNELIGEVPKEITMLRKLRFLILHANKFNGNIPSSFNEMKSLFYLDLSYNDLTGVLPESLSGCTKLRHAYLDHNKLSGPIPSSYGRLGGDWIIDLTMDSNQLTGGLPSKWGDKKKLLTLKVQNNNLRWEIPKDICKQWVLDGNGELVELGADCNICRCDFCRGRCYS